MDKAYGALPGALKAFLDHVHAHYPEIDMDESDDIAWSINERYINHRAFEESQDDGEEE